MIPSGLLAAADALTAASGGSPWLVVVLAAALELPVLIFAWSLARSGKAKDDRMNGFDARLNKLSETLSDESREHRDRHDTLKETLRTEYATEHVVMRLHGAQTRKLEGIEKLIRDGFAALPCHEPACPGEKRP